MNNTALKVRELLQQENIQAAVFDPVFVKPLDHESLCRLLLTHHKVVTIEEHSVVSGLGAILNSFLMAHGYSNVQVLNFGIPETFVEQGSHGELIKELGLNPDAIAHKIKLHFSLNRVPLNVVEKSSVDSSR
jgi:1-deoxy-D-xylulose-5-phosphate synthase